MLGRLDSRSVSSRGLLYFVLCLPALVPLLSPHPPFQDWPAQVGVIGALLHHGEPAANLERFYDYVGWLHRAPGFNANIIPYALGVVFGWVLPPVAAANLVLAISLGAVGPAAARLCRAAGGSEVYALLALPIALGRLSFSGFMPNVMALAMTMMVFASYLELRRSTDPRPPALRLVLWLLLVLFTHGFVFLATSGLLLVLLVVDLILGPGGARKASALGAVSLLVGAAFFFGLLKIGVPANPAPPDPGAMFAAVEDAIMTADRSLRLEELWTWLFASYRHDRWDDYFQGAWCALAFAGLAWTLVKTPLALFRRPVLQLIFILVVTSLAFYILPTFIGPPVKWWGGNLRLPCLIGLLLVPIVSMAPRAAPLSAALIVVNLGFVGAVFSDLVRWEQTQMKGLSQVIEEMPPGLSISAMHFQNPETERYQGYPQGYVGNYYVAEKGGYVPQNFFRERQAHFVAKQTLGAPPWGIAQGFRAGSHMAGIDGYLIQILDDRPDAPFYGQTRGALDLVSSHGHWRFYRRRPEGEAAPKPGLPSGP